jgi:hypothetical protein
MGYALRKMPNYSEESAESIEIFAKKFGDIVIQKFNDIYKTDKVKDAAKTVEEIRLIMEENIKKIVHNTDNIDVFKLFNIYFRFSKYYSCI